MRESNPETRNTDKTRSVFHYKDKTLIFTETNGILETEWKDRCIAKKV